MELPDCRTQIVDYYVDEYKQYHADVKYEGEICPDKSLIHHKKDPYHPAPAPYHAAPAPYHEEAPKNYQFGYDVHGYDAYGNPNVHSRTEARDGPNVKGKY